MDHSPSPEAGREGTEPERWVSCTVERQNVSGLAPAGCSLGLADPVPEPGSHLLGTAVQGKTGRGGENHSLMGGKSFEWPGARAPGVTVRSPSPFP